MRRYPFLFALWMLLLLAMLALGVYIIWQALSVPAALRDTLWESGGALRWLCRVV